MEQARTCKPSVAAVAPAMAMFAAAEGMMTRREEGSRKLGKSSKLAAEERVPVLSQKSLVANPNKWERSVCRTPIPVPGFCVPENSLNFPALKVSRSKAVVQSELSWRSERSWMRLLFLQSLHRSCT